MTAGVLLLTLAGLVVSAGLVAVAAVARGVSLLPAGTPSTRLRHRRQVTPLHLGALAAGVLVVLPEQVGAPPRERLILM
ncbi:hypothetical protein [Modestobacter italicus]|uniref:hypothetical protein n=1 Tax=Modestobacter italicus (strain DSM 44449 / CECT 9708 / BC 501) TaxID=2732864 RepID=UPI0005A25286|nr:hypothetical protein [Modestobacter marinus]